VCWDRQHAAKPPNPYCCCRAVSGRRRLPDTELLPRWILDATFDLQVARSRNQCPRSDRDRRRPARADELCPEGKLTRPEANAMLYLLAKRVVHRHLDPKSTFEEQADDLRAAIQHGIAAGREPSEELLEAQLEAAERVEGPRPKAVLACRRPASAHQDRRPKVIGNDQSSAIKGTKFH
jgi:hypothetical protein